VLSRVRPSITQSSHRLLLCCILQVEDEPGFSNAGMTHLLLPQVVDIPNLQAVATTDPVLCCSCAAGHVRAAASTCLAFLACHPLGAKGDACLWGPFRAKLLSIGALGVLLRAALVSSSDDPCNNIIQQTAAVGIMYLSTMVRAWTWQPMPSSRPCQCAAVGLQ
jgi:hypothetical protein